MSGKYNMLDVIVVGDIDTDTFYIVPHIPQWDEGVIVKEVYERPGGKGANTASALSRLGIKTAMLSAVGKDHFGEVGIGGLKSNGVDTSGVCVVDGAKTYYCIMMLDSTGEKSILVVDTNLIYPTPKILEEQNDYLLTAKHAHYIGLEPLRMAPSMQRAKEAGLTVSIDLDAGYQGLEACLQAIQWADIIFLNQQGAKTFFPDLETHTILHKLISYGPKIVILTSGKSGAAGYDGNEICSMPAFKVPVIDTTGAGDIFSASFIYAFLKEWGLDKSMKFASASAALSTAKIGGQSALSTPETIFRFLEKHAQNTAQTNSNV